MIVATLPEPTVLPPSRTQADIFLLKNPLYLGFFSKIHSIYSLKAACFRIFKVKIRSRPFLDNSPSQHFSFIVLAFHQFLVFPKYLFQSSLPALSSRPAGQRVRDSGLNPCSFYRLSVPDILSSSTSLTIFMAFW